jgi:putative hydrolase of HD superfamily
VPISDPLGRVAAATVDRQLAAYNAHDLEGFLATYADSVAVQNLGDTVAVNGKDALRQSTKEWFAKAPNVRSEVIDRMVMGPFVVDHERLTGVPGGSPLEVIGIFEVRDSLIRRVWFVPPPPRTE